MSENNFVKLGDVAHECRLTWSGGQTDIPIVGLEHLVPGEIELSSWDSNIEHTFSKKFLKGQVLLGRRRVYLKKAVVAPCDGICSGDITVIESTGGILPELLPFVIQNDRFFDYAMQGSAGSLSPRVKWEHLKNYEFSLPPLAEQKVLADKLWAAYRLKESYKKLLAATEEMVKSQFIEMFGNPLSQVQRYPLEKLGDCCVLNPRRPSISLSDTDMVSFVPMPCVSENGYLQDVADEEYGKVKKGFTYFENKDVLFAKITPCMENGKGAIAQELTNGIGMGSTEFHVLRPIEGKSNSYWLLALTRMPIFREQASKNMSGTGGQKRVGASFLDNFMVGLPPVEEQNRFERIYRQADKSGFDGRKSQFIEMFGTVKSTKPLTDFIDVSFPGEWGQEDKDGSGVKVIRTTNFTNNGKLDLSDVVTRGIDYAKVEKKKLSKGDIILERSGGTNDNPVGRVVYFEEDGVYLFNNFTQLLRCKEGVNSLFLFYSLFNYYQMNKNVIRSMSNKTTGIQNLKMDRYWQIPIADVSIERQKEFESIYRQADKSGSVLLKLSSR